MADATIATSNAALPLDLRVAIDLAVIALGGDRGPMRCLAIGDPAMVAEFGRYARIEESADWLVAFLAADQELATAIQEHRPRRVVVVKDGGLAALARRLGSTSPRSAPGLDNHQWRSLGYRRIDISGSRGAGSLFWATAERAARRFDRPDLADRCKVAMLRTMVLRGRPRRPSVREIHVYRRDG